MKTESLILSYLMISSGKKPGQIAVSIGRSVSTVKAALHAMTATGDVWYDAEACYYPAEPVGDNDKRYVTLCDKAIDLQDRNMWYRAARVWLEAHDSTTRPGLRQKAVICRRRCIENGNRLAPKALPDFPQKGKKSP